MKKAKTFEQMTKAELEAVIEALDESASNGSANDLHLQDYALDVLAAKRKYPSANDRRIEAGEANYRGPRLTIQRWQPER